MFLIFLDNYKVVRGLSRVLKLLCYPYSLTSAIVARHTHVCLEIIHTITPNLKIVIPRPFVSAHTCSPASPGCSRQANRKKFALADSRSLTCSRQISGSIPHPFGKTCVSAVPSKVCIENAVSVFCILLLCPPQPLALKLTRHTTLTKPRQSSFTSNCNPSLAKFLQLPTIREKLL